MKIKYTSLYLSFFQRIEELKPEEELFIAQLENNSDFEKEIIKVRKIFNIPLEGWPESTMGKKNPKYPWNTLNNIIKKFSKKTYFVKKDKRFRGTKLPNSINDFNLLVSYATKICRVAHIMNWWEQSILFLILFDVFPLLPADIGTTYYYDDRKKIDLLENSGEITIRFAQRMSKKQLHDWVDKEWNNGLKKDMDKLPPSPYSHITQIKVYKRIAELKKQGMTAQNISVKLEEEKMGTYYYDLIEPMYNRYKKYLSRR